jgi:hypothetical protein
MLGVTALPGPSTAGGGVGGAIGSTWDESAERTGVGRWIPMATTLVMGQEKCSDLVLSSLVRARFGELIASKGDHGKSDLFLLGMLSLMDAILEVPMGGVVEGLAFDPGAKAELLGAKKGSQTPLTPHLSAPAGARGRRMGRGYNAGQETQSVAPLREPGLYRSDGLGAANDQRSSGSRTWKKWAVYIKPQSWRLRKFRSGSVCRPTKA